MMRGVNSPYFVTSSISITPTYGLNLAGNPDMETGDPPTGWAAVNATLSSAADERTGGAGVASLNLARSGASNNIARRALVNAAGDWIRFGGWKKNVNATDTQYALTLPSPFNNWQNTTREATATWHERYAVGLVGLANTYIYCNGRAGSDGLSTRFDDATAKIISNWYTLYTHAYSYGDFSVNVTRTLGYQGGVIFNYQAVDYYSLCFVGGDPLTNQATVKLVDRTGTTVTVVGTYNITYVANAKLTVTVHKDGTRDVIYNGTSLATGIATSGLTGTQAGPFLTDASNVSISQYEWDAQTVT